MLKKFFQNQFLEYLNVILAVVVIFAPILYAEIYLAGSTSDYGSHIAWTKTMLENSWRVPPAIQGHATWQWILLIFHQIVGHSWTFSALAVTLVSVIATGLILFWALWKKFSAFLAGSLSVGLMLIAPLFFLQPFDNLWYMVNGYIGTNIYHNPTILLLKPFAVLQFYFSVQALTSAKSNWKSWLIPAICSVIAVFTKPNYAICLLPVLCILALIRLLKKQPVDWKKILCGIIIPSTAVLVWQFLITYGPATDSKVIVAPFAVMSSYSGLLAIKLLLSIAFPLTVTLLFWKDAVKDTGMQLGWLGFGIASIYTYFLAETGQRFLSGNFIWSAEISLFLLFLACILFLAGKKLSEEKYIKKWFVLTTGLFHVLFGIIFYTYLWYHLVK
jgi:hypothetical protein